jgi:hypothetical protein
LINHLITTLYDTHVDLPLDESFYQRVMKEIESTSISSQIYYLLKKQKKLETTPLFFQLQLKKNYQESLYQNLFIKSQTDKILEEFELMGIEVIPLKGVYFAERYFGHIGARATTDIDLLIKEKDINRAVETIKLMGFEIEEEPIPSHFHTSLSKKIPGSRYPLTVELHWDIVKETTAKFNIEEFWNKAIPLRKYRNVKILSDYHAFYMICLHGWRHNLDSPKYYLDIIQMIYHLKSQLNYEELFKNAEAHLTLKRMKRTLYIVYNEYPMLEQVAALSQRKRKRNVNQMGKQNGIIQYLQFIDYQFLSYDSIQHRLIELKQWLFPIRSVVLSQLKRDQKDRMYFFLLLFLYKQRYKSAIRAISSLF